MSPMNKKGIQLSINFTVLFILAMFVFAISIMTAMNLFNKANEVEEEIIDREEQTIIDMRLRGPNIINMEASKVIEIGGHDEISLNIRNDLKTGTDFYIEHECDAAFMKDETEICNSNQGLCKFCNDWLTYDESVFIARYDDRTIYLFAAVPNSVAGSSVIKGSYVYNIRICSDTVCRDDNQYGETKKLTIIVK